MLQVGRWGWETFYQICDHPQSNIGGRPKLIVLLMLVCLVGVTGDSIMVIMPPPPDTWETVFTSVCLEQQ